MPWSAPPDVPAVGWVAIAGVLGANAEWSTTNPLENAIMQAATAMRIAGRRLGRLCSERSIPGAFHWGGAGGQPAFGGAGGQPWLGGAGGQPWLGGAGGQPWLGGAGGQPGLAFQPCGAGGLCGHPSGTAGGAEGSAPVDD
jgi:hypothetical protein